MKLKSHTTSRSAILDKIGVITHDTSLTLETSLGTGVIMTCLQEVRRSRRIVWSMSKTADRTQEDCQRKRVRK